MWTWYGIWLASLLESRLKSMRLKLKFILLLLFISSHSYRHPIFNQICFSRDFILIWTNITFMYISRKEKEKVWRISCRTGFIRSSISLTLGAYVYIYGWKVLETYSLRSWFKSRIVRLQIYDLFTGLMLSKFATTFSSF